MKRYVSDINRIMALIYEDQPLPPPVPKEAEPFHVQNQRLQPSPMEYAREIPDWDACRRAGRKRLQKKKELLAAKPKLTLDFQSLDKIRSDAEDTMQKLITEDELAAETLAYEADAACADASPLSPVERDVLLVLLQGGNVQQVKTSGQLLSVLIDQINEKLFDTFADTVIDNGPAPQLIPDYEDELKEMFLSWNEQ